MNVSEPASHTRSRPHYDPLTLAIFGFLFAASILQSTFGAMLPFIRADLPMTHTVESLHITAIAVGSVLFSVISEPVRRRFGRKTSLIGAAMLSALGALGVALAVSPWMSITSMILTGAGMTGALIVGQSLLVGLHGRQAPRLIGEFNVVYSVGATIFSVVFPLVAISALGWRGYAGIQVVVMVLIIIPFLARGARKVDPNRTAGTQAVIGPRLRRPSLAMAIMPLAIVVEWFFLFWTATYLLDVAHLGKENAASAMVGLWIAVLVGRALGSWAVPRFGPHWVLTISLVLTLGAFCALNLVGSPLGGTVAAAIAGFGVANLYPASIALVVSSDPAKADQGVSRASFLTAVATIFSPFLLGALADAQGLGRAFYLVPVLSIITIAMIWIAGPGRARTVDVGVAVPA